MDNNHLKRISDSHWDADTLLAYKRGELPEDVRKKLLQEMENDPFLKDAVDGLAEIDAGTFATVLTELENSVHERTRQRRTMVISPNLKRYLAAAVLLMFLSVTLLVMNRLNKNVAEEQLSYNDDNVTPSIENPDGMGGGATTTEDFLSHKPNAVAPEYSRVTVQPEKVKDFAGVTENESEISAFDDISTIDAGSTNAGMSAPVVSEDKIMAATTQVYADYYTESIQSDMLFESTSTTSGVVSIASKTVTQKKLEKKADKKFRDKAISEQPSDADVVSAPAASLDSVAIQTQAQFPGGKPALDKYLNTYMQYPTGQMSGTIYIECTITSEGKIAEPFIREGLSTEANNEALRVVNAMPLWEPAHQNGSAVSSQVVIMVVVESN